MDTLKAQQVLIPKKVHIGDTAELRCTFNADSPVLKTMTSDGTAELTSSAFKEPVDPDYAEVLKVSLSSAGVNYYQITITFIPWTTGVLKFPNLSIGNIELSIKPEKIVSLAEEYKTSSIMEASSPLLLPGTSYKLYGSIILGILIIITVISVIVRRKKLCFFIKSKILQIKYRKNKKETIKKLCNLKNNKTETDQTYAENIQHILRHYLEFRFCYPFTKVLTSELVPTFYKITQGLLSDNKYDAFGEIETAFIRTDYIRYCKSKNAVFLTGEKSDMANNLIKSIEILEKEEEDIESSDSHKNAKNKTLHTDYSDKNILKGGKNV